MPPPTEPVPLPAGTRLNTPQHMPPATVATPPSSPRPTPRVRPQSSTQRPAPSDAMAPIAPDWRHPTSTNTHAREPAPVCTKPVCTNVSNHADPSFCVQTRPKCLARKRPGLGREWSRTRCISSTPSTDLVYRSGPVLGVSFTWLAKQRRRTVGRPITLVRLGTWPSRSLVRLAHVPNTTRSQRTGPPRPSSGR